MGSISRLAQESCCNISHIRFLKLIIFSIISVNVDEVESVNNSVQVKSHSYKPIDQIFVVSLVSWTMLANQASISQIVPTVMLAVEAPPPEI